MEKGSGTKAGGTRAMGRRGEGRDKERGRGRRHGVGWERRMIRKKGATRGEGEGQEKERGGARRVKCGGGVLQAGWDALVSSVASKSPQTSFLRFDENKKKQFSTCFVL